ncbi:MAG: arcadin 1 [Candidatus Bathyarchaeota archaeon]|nr:MAG: arcadin 1 [Candidatus Bathyarchaeota archaeon]
MNDVLFTVKVFSIHPVFDHQGAEYISVEFGYKPPKIPTMVPADVPKEVSDIIDASRDMVKVMVPPQLRSQMMNYANRLTVFLTPDEWNSLEQRYTVGDEFKIIIRPDGSLLMTKI